MRRDFLQQIAALALAAVSPLASAQSAWPERPIRLLVPYPPGGSLDPIARVLGQKMGELLGQPIVVENRPGGNTSIAAGFVAKAPPDGYNLLFSSLSTHAVHTMQANLPYDNLRDFTPVAAVSRTGYMLAVHPSVPARTLPELIAYAKANPGKLNYASAGIGNANHLAGELFNISAGVKTTHVPYKGGGPALMDLTAGRVQMYISTISALLPHIESGALRPLAYTSQLPGKPHVPTFEEAGLHDFEKIELVTMVLGPRDLPAPIVARLADVIQKVVDMPDARAIFERHGQSAFYMPPQQLGDRMKADVAKFTEIVDKAHIKLTER